MSWAALVLKIQQKISSNIDDMKPEKDTHKNVKTIASTVNAPLFD